MAEKVGLISLLSIFRVVTELKVPLGSVVKLLPVRERVRSPVVPVMSKTPHTPPSKLLLRVRCRKPVIPVPLNCVKSLSEAVKFTCDIVVLLLRSRLVRCCIFGPPDGLNQLALRLL